MCCILRVTHTQSDACMFVSNVKFHEILVKCISTITFIEIFSHISCDWSKNLYGYTPTAESILSMVYLLISQSYGWYALW